jgi:hypothetical protein
MATVSRQAKLLNVGGIGKADNGIVCTFLAQTITFHNARSVLFLLLATGVVGDLLFVAVTVVAVVQHFFTSMGTCGRWGFEIAIHGRAKDILLRLFVPFRSRRRFVVFHNGSIHFRLAFLHFKNIIIDRVLCHEFNDGNGSLLSNAAVLLQME